MHFIDVNRSHKICPSCGKDLPIEEFYKSTGRADGHLCYCKSCIKERARSRIKSEREINQRKAYGASERYKEIRNNYLSSEKGRQGAEKRKEISNKSHREYNKTEKGKLVTKISHKKRQEEGKVVEYYKKKRKEDPSFKIKEHLYNRLWFSLKRVGAKKSVHTLDLLGCSIEEFRLHIESQFQEGMTWENQGKDGWHLDHIIPCKYFDLSIEENQRICFNYRNLQPLWAKDNLKKSSKIPPNYQILYFEIKRALKID